MEDAPEGWPADRLVRLLAARPDLARPAPADLAELRRRAASRVSIGLAVRDLPTDARLVLDALALVPGADDAALTRLTATPPRPAALAAAVEELRVRLLLAPGSRVVPDAVLAHLRSPGRLGHSLEQLYAGATASTLHGLVASLGLTPGRSKAASLQVLLDALAEPQDAARVLAGLRPALVERLRELDRTGPVVAVPGLDAGRAVVPDAALQTLVRAGLVVLRGGPYVEVAREIALGLRHPAPLLLDLGPPEPPGARPADPTAVAAAGAAAAHGVVALVERLGAAADGVPLPLLASGGLGVRDLRRLGEVVGAGYADVALLLELMEVLGLLKVMSKEVRLTRAWEPWNDEDAVARWLRLVRAWHALPISPYPQSGRARPAFASYGDDDRALLRPRLLAVLREHADAAEPAVWAFRYSRRWYPEPADAWQAGPTVDAPLVADLLAEASLLGLVADGAPTPLVALTRACLAGLDDVGEQRVRAQADGTLVCTGTPSRRLRGDLDALAALESRGAATVWRLTEAALVQAYGAGWTPDGVRSALERWAGELPQAMSYLVDDAARRAGRLRTGAASSYLVAEDAAALADAVRVLKGVPLSPVSDTVAVSSLTQDALAAALAKAGLAAGGAGPVARRPLGKRAAVEKGRAELPPLPVPAERLAGLAARLASTA